MGRRGGGTRGSRMCLGRERLFRLPQWPRGVGSLRSRPGRDEALRGGGSGLARLGVGLPGCGQVWG
eukprot:720395-Heterocapsa_arctica.AAC.1